MSINIASEIVHFTERTTQAAQPFRRPDLPGAACLVSGADRCSVSSVRACVPVSRALHGLRCCLSCAAVPGVLEWAGVHRRGIQGAPGVGWVMPAIKFFKEKGVFGVPLANTHPHLYKTKPI